VKLGPGPREEGKSFVEQSEINWSQGVMRGGGKTLVEGGKRDMVGPSHEDALYKSSPTVFPHLEFIDGLGGKAGY